MQGADASNFVYTSILYTQRYTCYVHLYGA